MLILRDDTHKARKRHSCDSCCGTIEPGETYHRQQSVSGGDAWTYKAHQRCSEAAAILFKAGHFGEDPDGQECWVNMSDTDLEMRQVIFDADHSLYQRLWPNSDTK